MSKDSLFEAAPISSGVLGMDHIWEVAPLVGPISWKVGLEAGAGRGSVFIGFKIFVADMLPLENFPARVSLRVTLAIITAGIFYSLWRTSRTESPH